MDARIEVAGEPLRLLPERAAFWESASTLLIADPHFGKTATFRGAGLAVPGGTTADDLARLGGALARTGARRLVVLGDFFHAQQGRVPQLLAALAAWRERHAAVEVLLVRGNHDRHAGAPSPELQIAAVEPPLLESPFALAHHPEPLADAYVLAGHLHPAAVLRGAGRQRERLPCFWFGARVGVLPAFGGFTGMAEIRPLPRDRVWVVAETEVLPVPAPR